MNKEQKQNLVKAIEQTTAWERIHTSENGVYIIKAPRYNNHETVFVELNPSINGHPIKKRGIFLKNMEEFHAIQKLCDNKKIEELMGIIEEYYSKKDIPKIEL